ncbi:hypothetical protein BDW02DRAFT_584102 [Decorospora gaudefroyi]|uniref:Uncharacterized protein n=1 Tax=Decorospora gaudefroyi TaxID=184978 RepID=A0A6A5JWG5_9PLEO|nr:hypothetical protein BDW02DRAFT_584102 [Decorospora gaudefroyi]
MAASSGSGGLGRLGVHNHTADPRIAARTSTTSAETTPQLAAAEDQAAKRRKTSDGAYPVGAKSQEQLQDEVIQGLLRQRASLEQVCLLKEQSFLRKEQEMLEIAKQLQDKKQELTKAKNKYHNREEKFAAETDSLSGVIRGLTRAHLAVKDLLEEEKSKVIAKDTVINQQRQENARLQLEAMALNNTINGFRHELASRSTTQVEVPALNNAPPPPTSAIPDPCHLDRNYLHTDAPRQSGTAPKQSNKKNAGKLWPKTYGSNEHWDLGLCHVAHNTRGKCTVWDCQWRHFDLTDDERAYILELQPNGPEFLKWNEKCTR